MELQRLGKTVEDSLSKLTNTPSQIAELSKIKAPQHEPPILSGNSATFVCMNTVDTYPSLQSTGGSISTATTTDTQESIFSVNDQLTTATTTTDSSHLNTSNKQNNTTSLIPDETHTISIGNGCAVLPTVAVPKKHLNLWKNEIRERLEDEITQTFHIESHLEISMVSDAAGRVGTCILIICWDDNISNRPGIAENLRRKLQKKVSKFQTLRTYPFPCRIVIDEISLAAREILPDKRSIVIQIPTTAGICRPLNGLSIRSSDDHRRLCTLGGIIQIGDKICGMTVAHTFMNDAASYSSITSDGPEDYAQSDSEGNTEDLDAGFYFDKDDVLADNDIFQESQRSESDSDQRSKDFQIRSLKSVEHLVGSTASIIAGSIFATSTTQRAPDQVDNDWALIEFDKPPSITINTYHADDKDSEVLLKDIYKDELFPGLNVRILTHENGAQSGITGQATFKLVVSGIHLEVTQVVLSRSLAHGSSGIWVVKDDLVVGCIVAVRKFAMIAYMVSMKRIVEELDRIYSPEKVSIPTRNTHIPICRAKPSLQHQDQWENGSLLLSSLRKRGDNQPQSNLQQSIEVVTEKAQARFEASPPPIKFISNHSTDHGYGNHENKTNHQRQSLENEPEAKNFLSHGNEPIHTGLYRILVQASNEEGSLGECWMWYCRYLDNTIARDWGKILHPTIAGLDPEYPREPTKWHMQVAVVYRILETIAAGIRYRRYISLDDLITELDYQRFLRMDGFQPNRNVHRQTIWYLAGMITMLYEPRGSLYSGVLQLYQPRSGPRNRSVHGKMQSILYSEQDINTSSRPFSSILAQFGALLPRVEKNRENFSSANEGLIKVAYINFHTLKHVTNLEIEWVSTMNLHLQLDKRRRILQLYRFPSLCRLLWTDTEDSFMQNLFTDHLKPHMTEYNSVEHTFPDYLREIILSYRLLFGIEKKSQQAFRDELKNWRRQSSMKQDGVPDWASMSFQPQSQAKSQPNELETESRIRLRRRWSRSPAYSQPLPLMEEDPLLILLSTTTIPHKYTKHLSPNQENLARLLSLLHGEEKSMLYDLEDFPFLGERLVEIQRFSISHSPSDFKSLFWVDRRDMSSFYMSLITAALLIIGGATIILQLLQLVFQSWGTVMQYSQHVGR